jgi:hypothetical protein
MRGFAVASTQPDAEQAWQDFHSVVNMTSPEVRDWLASPYGAAGASGAELHELGRHIPELLGKRRTDLTDADVEAMRRVADTVRDLLGDATPAATQEDHAWRHALMTVGHDPIKPDAAQPDRTG